MKLRRTLHIYQNNKTLSNAKIRNNTSTKRRYISRSVKKPTVSKQEPVGKHLKDFLVWRTLTIRTYRRTTSKAKPKTMYRDWISAAK